MTAVGIRRACATAMVVASVALGACGGDDDEPAAQGTPEPTPAQTQTPAASGESEPLALAATEDGGLGFDPERLSAKAGAVTLTMDNPDGNAMAHNVALEGEEVDEAGAVVGPGGTSTASARLEAGEYTFYCAVGQHRQNGMEGTLTVE